MRKHGFFRDLIYPLIFVAAMWIVYFAGTEFDLDLQKLGLYPLRLSGLAGLIFSPLLHGSLSHLINNSLPMLVLGWALIHFYRPIAFRSFWLIYFISGLWLWLAGRPSYHIGASGVVYGLAAFLFVSGWLRREKKVAALSLLVAFLYGGMWWGVLPVDPQVSWEGHLWGGLAGIVLAIYFRKKGPQKPVYQWERDEKLEEAQKRWEIEHGLRPPDPEEKPTEPPPFTIRYHFRESQKNESKQDN